jgi:hypothetical protein
MATTALAHRSRRCLVEMRLRYDIRGLRSVIAKVRTFV